MKASRMVLLAALVCGGLSLQGCDKERGADSVTSSVDGSWQASFRVSSGELTEEQLSQAGWVRVEAWRSGTFLAHSEAAFSARKATLTIPSPGGVDIKLFGYSDSGKAVLMWTGSGAVTNGTSVPGKNVVTLAAGPGLQDVPVARDSSLQSLAMTPGEFTEIFEGGNAGPYLVTVPAGTTTVTVAATARTDADVQSITYNGSTNNAVTLEPSGNTTISVKVTNLNGNPMIYTLTVVKAAETPTYSLTTAAVNGTVALSPAGGVYDSGTSVTVVATPSSGFAFGSWSGACSGTGTCVVAMTKAQSVTATFVGNVVAPVAHDTSLKSILVNGNAVALTANATTFLADSLPLGTVSATVTATATATAATVTFNPAGGTATLVNDSARVSITVTNGSSSRTYTLRLLAKRSIPWQSGITYGSVTDAEGKSYKTVMIGTQRWMAENLNYAGSGSSLGLCYNGSADSCVKYGRLYTWDEVMNGAASSSASPSTVKGICPTEWHVPSDAEWATMLTFTDATMLKATSGWLPNGTISGNGTDAYGFRALPGGVYSASSSDYFGAGRDGDWWSSTLYVGNDIWYWYMYNTVTQNQSTSSKANRLSLRCVKDVP